jgi:antitoxin ChpS
MEDDMHIIKARQVGGSLMVAVPRALRDILHLRDGAKVGVTVENGRLVVEPRPQPHYTLDELLEQCDPSAPIGKEERDWLNAPTVGGELI